MKKNTVMDLVPVITDGAIVKQVVEVSGKRFNIHLHTKIYTYPEWVSTHIGKVTNDHGQELEGLWFWGTYGNVHRRRLDFDMRPGENYMKMFHSTKWCNGRKKNGNASLVDIVVVNPK